MLVHFINDTENAFKNSIAVWGKKKPKKVVPSILIAEKDAMLFKSIISKGKKVVLSIDIDSTPIKSKIVTLKYYIMINDNLSYELLNKLYNFRFSTPHLLVFKPIYAFKDQTADARHISSNCFNGNRYCVNSNKDQVYETGEYRDETIRQLCLWEQSNKNNMLERNWWKYVTTYSKVCFTKGAATSLKECSELAFGISGVAPDIIKDTKRCFNRYIEQYDAISMIEKQEQENYEFEQYPGIIVNDNLVRGYRTSKSIITSVCDAYVKKPPKCLEYEPQIEDNSHLQDISSWRLYGVLTGCIGLILCFVVLLKTYLNQFVAKSVEEDVRDHVNTYYKINETDSKFKDTELTPAENTG